MRITKIRRLGRRVAALSRQPVAAERPMLRLIAAGVVGEACRLGGARATFRDYEVRAQRVCVTLRDEAVVLVVLSCKGERAPLESLIVQVAGAPVQGWVS